MSKENNLLHQAVVAAGGYSRVARETGVSDPAVHGWVKRGLPPTEWTGETQYAKTITRLTKRQFTKKALLAYSLAMRQG